VRERLVRGVEPELAPNGERDALLRRAADHVGSLGPDEGEKRAEPPLGHVEHDLVRLDAASAELLEHELGE